MPGSCAESPDGPGTFTSHNFARGRRAEPQTLRLLLDARERRKRRYLRLKLADRRLQLQLLLLQLLDLEARRRRLRDVCMTCSTADDRDDRADGQQHRPEPQRRLLGLRLSARAIVRLRIAMARRAP